MPTGKGGKAEERRGSKPEDRRGSNSVKRETFRPPWVKDDPDGLPPKPSNLWSKTRKNSKDGGGTVDGAEGSKKADIVKATEPQENGTKEHIFVKPQLKPVPPKDTSKLQSREVKIPIKLNSVKKTKSIDESLEKVVPPEKNPIMRQDSLKKIGNIPKPPPIPPPAPKLPRPTELKALSNKQKEHIEALKNRPKVRPDWTSLLKEVESGAKLKHVQCNDRSKPLLPKAMDNDKNAFIYESEKKEKGTAHNKLLNEIQHGVALKKTKTNDRSKPMLEGLRKFRRQMTIEEQIIKSQSMASIPPEEIPELVDELDDIDRVRDDLQSTKQMLAMELRNKEALARENKRIATRLAQLEAELEKEKSNKKTTSVAAPVETDDKLVKTLKSEAADAKKTAEDLEKKYNDANSQLDNTKTELEEVRKQKLQLEKKLMDSLQDKRLSISDRKESIARSESEKEESCESDGGSDEESKKERKALKEYKQFRNKLRSNKNKEDNAKKERMALKTQIKRLQQGIKDEKKKYKSLKKEVNKMAALMKEVSDEEDEGEEKEEPEETEEEAAPESESESESESSEDSESEKSLSEAEDAPVEKKKANVVKRTKKHEGRLSALKKGNYILKTNVERLQDDLNKQKDLSLELQQDLDSVLSELG